MATTLHKTGIIERLAKYSESRLILGLALFGVIVLLYIAFTLAFSCFLVNLADGQIVVDEKTKIMPNSKDTIKIVERDEVQRIGNQLEGDIKSLKNRVAYLEIEIEQLKKQTQISEEQLKKRIKALEEQ